jgi:hypothetical protein
MNFSGDKHLNNVYLLHLSNNSKHILKENVISYCVFFILNRIKERLQKKKDISFQKLIRRTFLLLHGQIATVEVTCSPPYENT